MKKKEKFIYKKQKLNGKIPSSIEDDIEEG
jgi:hypothetical protein